MDWGELERLLPRTTLALAQSYFLAVLSARDRATALDVSLPRVPPNVEALQGDLTWEVAGRACGWQPEWQRRKTASADSQSAGQKADAGDDGVETLGGFLSGIAAELSGENTRPEAVDEKAAVGEGDADELPSGRTVVTYRWAVQSLAMGKVRERQLVVPPDFERGTRF